MDYDNDYDSDRERRVQRSLSLVTGLMLVALAVAGFVLTYDHASRLEHVGLVVGALLAADASSWRQRYVMYKKRRRSAFFTIMMVVLVILAIINLIMTL
jgi:predicted nucleic acid-binding Zn ribbon protein